MISATYRALSREQYIKYTKFLCVDLAIHCIIRLGNNTWCDDKKWQHTYLHYSQQLYRPAHTFSCRQTHRWTM